MMYILLKLQIQEEQQELLLKKMIKAKAIVIDLSKQQVKPEELSNILKRVEGSIKAGGKEV